MAFRTAFFAFPNQPEELKLAIVAAVGLANQRDDLRIQSWPQLPIFGAAIPEEVRGAIAKTDVLVCDITTANLNVYYEVGYCIGLAKSIAPVINVSFANATTDVQKDGLFDIIGYGSYTDAAGLATLLETLPSTVLLDLYGRPLNTNQPIYFLNTYRKTEFVNWIGAAIKESKVNFRSRRNAALFHHYGYCRHHLVGRRGGAVFGAVCPGCRPSQCSRRLRSGSCPWSWTRSLTGAARDYRCGTSRRRFS
jgi:nucleoside 2-deoxyribosyltransferase